MMKNQLRSIIHNAGSILLGALGLSGIWSADVVSAPTIWNGQVITFSKASGADPALAANQDRITANVWITRGNTHGIYNIRTEDFYEHNVSPAGTEWAYGTTAQYATLAYQPWESWTGGPPSGPPSTVGANAVLHLISEDIYIDIKFVSWGIAGGGEFSYQRSTPGNSQPAEINLGVSRLGPAGIEISASGLIPGTTNVLQRSVNLGQSASWTSLATNVAQGTTASFTNAVAPGRAFFRLLRLP